MAVKVAYEGPAPIREVKVSNHHCAHLVIERSPHSREVWWMRRPALSPEPFDIQYDEIEDLIRALQIIRDGHE